MARRPTPQGNLDDLIYWSGEDPTISGKVDEDGDLEEMQEGTAGDSMHDTPTNERESMYVTLFERMGQIVLRHEAHLLSPAELLCLNAYNTLSYRAKFLLVRLALRKHGKVHRLSKLPFQSELGPYIPDAIAELCRKKTADAKTRTQGAEIIDLTSDDENPSADAVADAEPDLTFFAEDESSMTLSELLGCMTMPEITALAKEFKVEVPHTRYGLIAAIVFYSSTQSALEVAVITAKSKGKQPRDAKPSRQTRLSFPAMKLKSAMNSVRAMVLKILNKCVRINFDVLKLFRRLNIIFFRDTQIPDKILTPSLLCRAKKRFYPSYEFTRTHDVWKTREDLLDFEKALELEEALRRHLDTSGGISGSRKGKASRMTPAPFQKDDAKRTAPMRTKTSVLAQPVSTEVDIGITQPAPKDDADILVLGAEDQLESPRITDAKAIKAIFESVFPRWKELLSKVRESGDAEEEARRRRGLRRFECGYVYTRIVQKGAEALAVLGEHDRELEVLEALLSQRRWRRGSRGAWHDRRALILMRHLKGSGNQNARALDAVIEGLKDDDTHIVHRLKLEKRLTALEKKLKIPEEDRHSCAGALVKPAKVFIEGVRVQRAAGIASDSTGSKLADTERKHGRDLISYGVTLMPRSPCKDESNQPLRDKEESTPWQNVGKSVWVGRDGEDVSVETLALQEYESHGYKGFHCEGRIVTTLFGLLFWDILFADIPGALETPWQSAPMDIAEDSFYFARQELIERRLSEIEAGQGPGILARFDEMHREQGTLCVGVRWDLFQRQDLVEIAQCIGCKPLSVICRLLAEDYTNRTSGVADLVVWNMKERECRFVEVKGPGDTERENQKIWLDVLLRAGLIAEVCRVEERGHPGKKKGGVKRVKKRRPAREVTDGERENDLPTGNPTKRSADDELPRYSGKRRCREEFTI